MNTKRAMGMAVIFVTVLACQSAQAFYNPHTGRWLSRDPIGEKGSEAARSLARRNRSKHVNLEYCAFGNSALQTFDPVGAEEYDIGDPSAGNHDINGKAVIQITPESLCTANGRIRIELQVMGYGGGEIVDISANDLGKGQVLIDGVTVPGALQTCSTGTKCYVVQSSRATSGTEGKFFGNITLALRWNDKWILPNNPNGDDPNTGIFHLFSIGYRFGCCDGKVVWEFNYTIHETYDEGNANLPVD